MELIFEPNVGMAMPTTDANTARGYTQLCELSQVACACGYQRFREEVSCVSAQEEITIE
jgi:hypothetical protein